MDNLPYIVKYLKAPEKGVEGLIPRQEVISCPSYVILKIILVSFHLDLQACQLPAQLWNKEECLKEAAIANNNSIIPNILQSLAFQLTPVEYVIQLRNSLVQSKVRIQERCIATQLTISIHISNRDKMGLLVWVEFIQGHPRHLLLLLKDLRLHL